MAVQAEVWWSQTWHLVPLGFVRLEGMGLCHLPWARGCGCGSQGWDHLACARSFWGWGWGSTGLALWSSLRISFCNFFEEDAVVVSPKQTILDLNNLKSQTLMELFPAFLILGTNPLKISDCPPWRKDRTERSWDRKSLASTLHYSKIHWLV